MGRALAFLYGAVSYVIFFVTFLYAIAFVGDIAVVKTVDSGTGAPGPALVVNLLLLSLFAVQHSVMARPWFKRGWTNIVPKPVERSTYVLLASLILLLLFWKWRPMEGVVWDVQGGAGAGLLNVLFWAGWGLVLLSTFVIDHFDLFGLRQVILNFRKVPYEYPSFQVKLFYKVVRHPLLLGFVIAFWATPHMTRGHLLFAVVTTLYMLIAIRFEEHDLEGFHGQAYADYRRQVPMIVPIPGKSYKGASAADESSREPSSESGGWGAPPGEPPV